MTDAILDRARELMQTCQVVLNVAPENGHWLSVRDVCTALLAADERMHKLEEALRKHCIKHAECAECGKSWMFPFGDNYPEEHAPDCLAALQEGGK